VQQQQQQQQHLVQQPQPQPQPLVQQLNGWGHAQVAPGLESFALVLGHAGEVSHACSRGLGDPGRFPHFSAARQYLIGALQLDLAAAALRARSTNPLVDAVLSGTAQHLEQAAAGQFGQLPGSTALPAQPFGPGSILQDAAGKLLLLSPCL
jgi:hypothetical protein